MSVNKGVRAMGYVSIGLIGIGCIYGVIEATPRNVVTIPEAAIDLGDVWAQKEIESKIPIRNATNNIVAISKIIGSCKCAKIWPTSVVIDAGGEEKVAISIDAGPVATTEPLPASRQIDVGISFHIDGAHPSIVRKTVTGLARHWLRLSESSVVFEDNDNVFSPQHSFRSKHVLYQSYVPIRELTATTDSDDVTVVVKNKSESTGILEIIPSSKLRCGRFQGNILLEGVTPSSQKLPTASLAVSGIVLQDVFAVPSEVALGAVTLGSTTQSYVSFVSRTGSEFVVTPQQPLPKGVKVRMLELGGNSTIEVELTDVSLGRQHAQLLFTVHSLGEEEAELPLNVSYFGTSANGI